MLLAESIFCNVVHKRKKDPIAHEKESGNGRCENELGPTREIMKVTKRSDKRVRMRGVSLIDRTYDILKDGVESRGTFKVQDPIQNPLA